MNEESPHKWVIEITQLMTTQQACDLGKALGLHGYTGHFHSGDVASLVRDGAKWRHFQKGGDDDGGLDQVVL